MPLPHIHHNALYSAFSCRLHEGSLNVMIISVKHCLLGEAEKVLTVGKFRMNKPPATKTLLFLFDIRL